VKTYWGAEGIVPRILNIDTRWKWVVSSRLGRFTLSKWRRYTLYGRLDGPQNRSERGGEDKKIPSLSLPRIELRLFSLATPAPTILADMFVPPPPIPQNDWWTLVSTGVMEASNYENFEQWNKLTNEYVTVRFLFFASSNNSLYWDYDIYLEPRLRMHVVSPPLSTQVYYRETL
jgi:hypothetical protein